MLLEQNVKMIVIACNTASAHATAEVTAMAAPVPVIGMVEPATAAALDATENNNILVMATQSTTRHASYPNALRAGRPDIEVEGVGCQILVALAEEGWLDGPVAHAVVERYIGPFFARAGERLRPDTIILGCTHFPLLKHLVADIAGPDVALIDSGGAGGCLHHRQLDGPARWQRGGHAIPRHRQCRRLPPGGRALPRRRGRVRSSISTCRTTRTAAEARRAPPRSDRPA